MRSSDNRASKGKAARQQHLQGAEGPPADMENAEDDPQATFDATETLKMLCGARHHPGPNDWLTKVGLIDADDPIMREIDVEGRRLRKSQKPI